MPEIVEIRLTPGIVVNYGFFGLDGMFRVDFARFGKKVHRNIRSVDKSLVELIDGLFGTQKMHRIEKESCVDE